VGMRHDNFMNEVIMKEKEKEEKYENNYNLQTKIDKNYIIKRSYMFKEDYGTS
jgi:hypothetical protein